MKTLWARVSRLLGSKGEPPDGEVSERVQEDDPLQLRATEREIRSNDARLRYLDYQVQLLEGRVFNDHQSRRDS